MKSYLIITADKWQIVQATSAKQAVELMKQDGFNPIGIKDLREL